MSLLLCSYLSTLPPRVIGSFWLGSKVSENRSFYPPLQLINGHKLYFRWRFVDIKPTELPWGPLCGFRWGTDSPEPPVMTAWVVPVQVSSTTGICDCKPLNLCEERLCTRVRVCDVRAKERLWGSGRDSSHAVMIAGWVLEKVCFLHLKRAEGSSLNE